MTRNQRYVVKIMDLLKKRDNANVEYDAYTDDISFWFNYGNEGVQRITISSRDSILTAENKIKEIAYTIKNNLVKRGY